MTAAVFVFFTCVFPVTAPAETAAADRDGYGYFNAAEIDEYLTLDDARLTPSQKKKLRKKAAALPEAYDTSEKPFYEGYVGIRDQIENTCWACGAATAAQISFLKELYDKGKSLDHDYEPSYLQMAYFFYNRAAHPYGDTENDRNIPLQGDYRSNGGNNYYTATALSNRMGFCRESLSHKLNKKNAYNTFMTLENARYLPNRDSEDAAIQPLDPLAVKEAIMDHGAVLAQMYYNQNYLYTKEDFADYVEYEKTYGGEIEGGEAIGNYMGYFCNYKNNVGLLGDRTSNHAVTIVGWDDTFSRDRFLPSNRPENDGAWIVQNSHGIDSEYNINDNGFLYVSYEDLSLSGAIVFDMQPAEAYDACFQYDGNAYAVPAGGVTKTMGSDFATVYTVSDAEYNHTLRAVGYTTWNTGKTDCTVRIYTGVQDVPDSGEPAAEFDVSTSCPGSYTFALEDCGAEPVKLKTGEKFAVEISPSSTKDADQRFHMGYERSYGKDSSFVEFVSSSREGRCFYRGASESAWKDLYQVNDTASFRIKALTSAARKPSVADAKIVPESANYSYTGKTITPALKVTCDGNELEEGTDYTVAYANNNRPGIAKMNIKGRGEYTGSVTRTFSIAAIEQFRASSRGRKSLRLAWKASPNMNGYKIYRYASGKYRLIETIKDGKTVSFKDKKLKPKKTYKYKIRAFVKTKGGTYCGPISQVLKAKTK